MASTSEARDYPRKAKVIHKRRHAPDVENSICQILHSIGSPNPKAFTRRWPLEDVIEGLNEVRAAMADSDDIDNPPGLLWRILERNEQDKQQQNGGE